MRAKVLFTFLIVCSFFSSKAQVLPFEHLNEQNGLPQMSINVIHQGRMGFLWLGTDNGIYRYDGNNFERFLDETDSNSIQQRILDIQNNYNSIFALSETKVYQIETMSGIRKIFPLPPGIKQARKILAFRNEILIGAENGLWRLDPISGKFANAGINEPISTLKHIKQGKALICSVEKMFLYYPFNQKLFPIFYQPASFIRHAIVISPTQIAWIEADHYFHRATLTGNKIQITHSVVLSQTAGSTSFCKYGDFYYMGLEQGLLSFNENHKEQLLTENDEDFSSLSQNHITSLLADEAGNFWVATKLGGINLYHPYRHKFKVVSPQTSSKFSKCKEILSFEELSNKQILLQSSIGGLGIFDPNQNNIVKWIPTGLKGNCMMAENDERTSFLIGSPQGLFRYKTGASQLEFISTKFGGKNFESDIKCMLRDAGNTVWMGGVDGLFLFDLQAQKTILYYGIGNSQLGSENIRQLYRKSADEIYVCTQAGLYVFNPSRESFTMLKVSGNLKQPMVSGLQLDSRGRLWVATTGEGIYVLDANGNSKPIGKREGLANNQIYSIRITENHCWVSHNAGLSVINCANFLIHNYGLHDGLQGSEYTESSSWLSSDGQLYFGGVNGFNYFYPNQVKTDTNACKIEILGLSVFNKKEPFQSYYYIPIEKNYITFDFTALDYYLTGGHTFYYKLDGLQNEWTEIGDRHFASFGELRQGDYSFRVKVKNPDGKMSNKEAVVYFSVVPPFYQTWWIKTAIVLLLSIAIAFIIYLRIKNAIADEQEKGKQSRMIAELELKALRAQMNPHFIFNSLNSIQDFVLNNEGQMAAKYLSKFARLIRMILDISEQTFVNIQLKVDFLKLYIELEALRLNNSFTWDIEIDPQIDLEARMPTLLIQPHIENAIWHGLQYKQGNRNLHIRMSLLNENMLLVEVEDNGIGRKAALKIKENKTNLHQSKGARISEERIVSLNKLFGSKPKIEIIDLFDENNLACGTKVLMKIPIIHG